MQKYGAFFYWNVTNVTDWGQVFFLLKNNGSIYLYVSL